jgi:hypothetical protein
VRTREASNATPVFGAKSVVVQSEIVSDVPSDARQVEPESATHHCDFEARLARCQSYAKALERELQQVIPNANAYRLTIERARRVLKVT